MASFARISVTLWLMAAAFVHSAETKIPAWIPSLEGSVPKVINAKKIDKGEEVILNFNTPKTPKDLKEFYSKGFEAQGFKDIKAESIDDEGVSTENMKGHDEKRYWWVSTRREKNAKETVVSIVYEVKE